MGVPAVIAAIGTGFQVAGQVESARQQKRAGRRRSKELVRAAEVERERGRRLRSAQRARFGAAGLTAAGTPLLVQNQALVDSLLDQEAILAGARNAREEGRLRGQAAQLGAFATGLRGLSGLAGQFDFGGSPLEQPDPFTRSQAFNTASSFANPFSPPIPQGF